MNATAVKIPLIRDLRVDNDKLECSFTRFCQYKAFTCHCKDFVFSIALPERTKPSLEGLWYMRENLS